MTVIDLKKELENYDDNAEVIGVDWSNGQTFDVTIGSDDEDEGEKYCRLSFE